MAAELLRYRVAMMNAEVSTTQRIERLLGRVAKGDADARDELLQSACGRLLGLTRKMLRGFPVVQRWEQTDDVFQNATLRLCRALEDTIPADARHFYRLAAVQIRRELIDLSRRYQGPLGMGKHHASQGASPQAADGSVRHNPAEGCDTTHDPRGLIDWSEFHQQVEQLPDAEREVFDLLWYHGLSQAEAAEALGISTRTVKRHWQSARLTLSQRLGSVGDL